MLAVGACGSGDLTTRGLSSRITERTTDIDASAGFNATTKINRKDWNLNWNVALETGGWLVGDTITINIELELVKQVEQAADAETVAA